MSQSPPTLVLPSRVTVRRVIAGTVVVAAVVVSFLLLYRFRMVGLIVFTGLVLSIAVAPGVDWLHRHQLPRPVSLLIIYSALLSALAIFIYLIVPQFVQQMVSIVPKIERDYLEVRATLLGSPSALLHQLASQLPASINLFPAVLAAAGPDAAVTPMAQALSTVSAIFTDLLTLTAILLIGFYWALEGERAVRSSLLLVAPEKREGVHEIIGEIETRVGGYIRGQFLLAGSFSLAVLIAYLVIGLPSALSVALLAGLFSMVPVFGPTLGIIPAVLVSFAADPGKLAAVVVVFTVLQFIESNLLAPHVMRKTVGVNAIVTLLAIIAFGSLFGLAGLLLAIPIAAIIQILLDRSLLQPRDQLAAAPAGRGRLSKLRYDTQELAGDVRKLIRRKESGHHPPGEDQDDLEDAIEAIATELDNVLDRAAWPEASA